MAYRSCKGTGLLFGKGRAEGPRHESRYPTGSRRGGRKVRLRIVPVVSYLEKKYRREIRIEDAAVEVTIRKGEEVRLDTGGKNREFYRHFLVGYDEQRRVQEADLFVRFGDRP